MFIGTSTFEHYIVRFLIYALRSVTPLSFVHLFLACFSSTYPLKSYIILNLSSLLECTFYLFIFLPRKPHLQKPATHPPRLSRTARSELLNRCKSHLPDPEDFVRGWQLPSTSTDTTIRKENIKDWLLWGFFSASEIESEIEEELDECIRILEESLGREIPDGRNESIKSIRLTYDDPVVYHRPFVWYMIVMVVDILVALQFYLSGFRHYTAPIPVFPPRPYTLFSSRSASETQSYWYRPPLRQDKSSPNPALLFLHGIGIGLFPYAPLLLSYAKKHPEAPIIVPDLLYISSRLTPAPPSQSTFRNSIQTIFKHHGIEEYSITAHSYGTGLATALVKPKPGSDFHPPSSLVLLDPVSILLHLPSVARNFLYRPPKAANEHELYYFACTDPGVAHTLSRHFFWTENILWKEDLATIGQDENESSGKPRVAVILSGKDIILDAPAIWTYLTGLPPPTDEGTDPWPFMPPTPHPSALVPTRCDGEPNILATYLAGLDHAQMFLSPVAWRAVIDTMDAVSSAA